MRNTVFRKVRSQKSCVGNIAELNLFVRTQLFNFRKIFTGCIIADCFIYLCIKINVISDLIVFGFITFGQSFIRFYVGIGYEDSYWVAIFMMIPGAIPLVQSMCLSIIIAENRHRLRSLVLLGITILNVIGTWILLQVWGVIGAALMTGIALLLGNGIVLNWYYWKKIGLNIPKFWKEIGRVFVLPIILMVIYLMLGICINWYNLLNLFVGIISYTIAFCGLSWKFSMNDYEKELFLMPIRNIYRKLRKK